MTDGFHLLGLMILLFNTGFFFFDTLEIRQIQVDTEHLFFTVNIGDHDMVRIHENRIIVFVLQDHFTRRNANPVLYRFGNGINCLLTHFIRDDQVFQLLSQGLISRVSIQPFAGPVPENDPALSVVTLNRDIPNRVENRMKTGFALLQPDSHSLFFPKMIFKTPDQG